MREDLQENKEYYKATCDVCKENTQVISIGYIELCSKCLHEFLKGEDV